MNVENRSDCHEFKPKTSPHQCGDCQTDGHYLCIGCAHIADFDSMELSDNRMRYYSHQETIRISEETMKDIYSDDKWHSWKCICGCLNRRSNGNCGRCMGLPEPNSMFYGDKNYHNPLGRMPYTGNL